MRLVSPKLRFLLASGPTREPLDPVRYLSNYSTGTMGRHLAKAILSRRHKLTWVQSPQDAETARALLARLKKELPKNDVLIMASAVCDVRPASVSTFKIKKKGLQTIRLVENPDVVGELGKGKKARQVFVGFALESKNVQTNALDKLRRKRLELILAQKVTSKKAPFGEARIEAVAYGADGFEEVFRNASKAVIAGRLVRMAEVLAQAKAGL